MRTIDLGPLDRIPPGEGRSYQLGGEHVAVFRTRDGGLYATQAFCPHGRGLLSDGLVGDGRVICPLHGLAFELDSGRCLSGSCPDLRTHPVRHADGSVVLSLPAEKELTPAEKEEDAA